MSASAHIEAFELAHLRLHEAVINENWIEAQQAAAERHAALLEAWDCASRGERRALLKTLEATVEFEQDMIRKIEEARSLASTALCDMRQRHNAAEQYGAVDRVSGGF